MDPSGYSNAPGQLPGRLFVGERTARHYHAEHENRIELRNIWGIRRLEVKRSSGGEARGGGGPWIHSPSASSAECVAVVRMMQGHDEGQCVTYEDEKVLIQRYVCYVRG